MIDYILSIVPGLLGGLWVSGQIFLLTIVLSLPFGDFFWSMVRLSHVLVLAENSRNIYLCNAGNASHAADSFIYYGLPLIPGFILSYLIFRRPYWLL